jgi:trehalose-6-phosphate synthase
MPVEERRRRLTGLQEQITARNPGDWIDEQLRDIRDKEARSAQQR